MRLFIDKDMNLVAKFGEYTSAEYFHQKLGYIQLPKYKEDELIEIKWQRFSIELINKIEISIKEILANEQKQFELDNVKVLIDEKQRQLQEERKQRRQSYDVEEKLCDIMLERSVK
jgi:hypothetical protein